jgi:hypothetical protein
MEIVNAGKHLLHVETADLLVESTDTRDLIICDEVKKLTFTQKFKYYVSDSLFSGRPFPDSIFLKINHVNHVVVIKVFQNIHFSFDQGQVTLL